MSRAERRALVLVLVLGVAGHLIRAAGGGGDLPPPVELFDPATDGDPLAHRDRARALAAPLAADERINIDEAGAEELRRLPGVGPALAQRIVADREDRGAFGGIDGLDRVPGIGPATLARLTPHLRFSPRSADPWMTPHPGLVSLNRAAAADLERLPGIGPRRAAAIVAFRDSVGPFREVAELGRVPGISSALVAQLGARVRLP